MDHKPIKDWTESEVCNWLKSIKINEKYIDKIREEEVNGEILLVINEEYLEEKIGMKSGPAFSIINKRDEWVRSSQMPKTQTVPVSKTKSLKNPDLNVGKESKAQDGKTEFVPKRDCKPRPFCKPGLDFKYVKHNVLQPEAGAGDLISPCHEYKSLEKAADLDRARLQAKLAKETLKFACGCLNIRSNGTIHFGVMDSVNTSYVHGEIIGVPIQDKDIYVDALDYIERSFQSDSELVRKCIRPPEFVQVVDMSSTETKYVVEIDIVSTLSIVSNRVFTVRLPNFNEKSNKVEFEKKTIYRRVGSKTEPVDDLGNFYSQVSHRDNCRRDAENAISTPDVYEDLGRKLAVLIADGKKFIDKEKWHILVTNKFQKEHLKSIDFLQNLRILTVFDFDPDSKLSGFCSEYLKHHAANLHFLQDYRIQNQMSIKEFECSLRLFEQVSWIFCNGRTDFRGNETACDEMTWVQTKKSFLTEAVSLICKQILPRGTFSVIFLLTSPLELPVVHTFHAFFAEMQGHEDIICISESLEDYNKWEGYAATSCSVQMVSSRSVAGMKLNHVNATIQQLQPSSTRASRHLSLLSKGLCLLETVQEERMSSLDILSVDQCDNTNDDFKDEIEKIEQDFYRGGKVSWMNFWLSEKKYVGEFIERDVYRDVFKLITDTPKWSPNQTPVNDIKIYHLPGSGGSTIARHVLWNNRKNFRCAVVKPSFPASTVAEHAVKLREYEEADVTQCLPVLLLVEDFEREFLEDLRKELEVATRTKKVTQGTLCFILLSCIQSRDPEKMRKESPFQSFAVTHKLSPVEKRQFEHKMPQLEEQYSPEFIITAVMMSKEFNRNYVKKFVKDLLQGINRSSVVTRLIVYVALLNTYVQNSYLSQSHCEALLLLAMQMNTEYQERKANKETSRERFRRHLFEITLTEQAKVLFIHLKDEKTHLHCIRMINPVVAEEVLHQLLGSDQQQSKVVLDLLAEDVLFQNNFGKDCYHKFLRNLCMRRNKISQGDKSDTSFSPLIEHIMRKEAPENAVEVLEAAYKRFNEDPFFAQQLARLHYTNENFLDAQKWAEVGEKKLPHNSFILDTKGHVYKRWFNAKCKLLETVSPESTVDVIATALEAVECFKTCQEAASSETETMNNSGYFSEVEVEHDLINFVLKVFSHCNVGHSQCLRYLVTDYIPDPVKKPWECFHSKLKYIHKNMFQTLERISEDLSYFQTEIGAEEDESHSSEVKIRNPINWLAKKTTWYGTTFKDVPMPSSSESQLSARMNICSLGGGNITTIFSLLSEKKEAELTKIAQLYHNQKMKLDQTDLTNYIASRVALGCLLDNPNFTLDDLQKLSEQFPKDRSKCQSNALFLLTLLFWPEDDDVQNQKDVKRETIMSAVECLKKSYNIKKKGVPFKESRVFTHFFLGKERGLKKIVHKSKMKKLVQLTLTQKRMKWFSGDVWKTPEITALLKHVQGWTENGNIYIEGAKGKEFKILALNSDSVPDGNENVEFYLGFTFKGPVACGITVSKTDVKTRKR
ncbi:sterile alpha motif domain-containing protein 9-like [Arapaima gigas]